MPRKTHGLSGTRIYHCWHDMVRRCYDPKCRNYKHYGAKGISVCEEWKNDFTNFYKWAENNGYSENLTIDRIDFYGNYEPTNCRWVDMHVQNANRPSRGKCEYIGVYLNSNGSSYTAQIKQNGKIIFLHCNRSKNSCALARNNFIVENHLEDIYPLNEIKEEFEDLRESKHLTCYIAISRETGEVFSDTKLKNLAGRIGVTEEFFGQCVNNKRVSRKYIFKREEIR